MGITLIVSMIVAQFLAVIFAFGSGRDYKTDAGDRAIVWAIVFALAAPVLAYIAGGL